MRINEIIVGDPIELDEGWKDALAKGVGATAQGIGAVAGGAAGAWDRMKQGYAKGKAAVAGMHNPETPDTTAPASTGTQAAQTTAPATTTAPAAGTAAASGGTAAAPAQAAAPSGQAPAPSAPAPQATPDELEDLKNIIGKLNPDQKQSIAAELQKPEIQQAPGDATKAATPAASSAPAAPAGSTYDPAKAKADRDAKAAADRAEADKQIAATKAANAEKAKQDAAIKAAKDAAMAKPGFQQTAADKLAIQRAQQAGIREAVTESKQPKKPAPKQPAKKPAPGKKKKIVAEFDSKFLGRKI